MTSDRLSVIDEIFLRTHRGYGLPIVLQGLLRSDETIARVELAAAHANLSMGLLGRKVVTPSIPGARRRWAPNSESLPLAFEDSRLAESELLDWADAQADVDLDPEYGPGWRLSSTTTDNGGTLASLVCSHALADAAGLISAAVLAFGGTAPQHHLSHHSSDLLDAVRLGTSVTARSLRAVAGLTLHAESRRELTAFLRAPKKIESHSAVVTTAVFDIDGAMTNAEFISLVSGIAVELGHRSPVTVNVPFRSSTPGANGIGMATIEVSPGETVADIGAACKAAFTGPAGAPSGFPAEAVQLLPDRVAASLTAGPGSAPVLCSNIGKLPAAIYSIGPHRARTVATRAMHPGAEGTATVNSLSAYLASTGTTSTLSLVGTDAQLAPTSDALRDGAQSVLTRRRLDARSWR
ncbi:hypothetical protein [Rhodococcoides yunnanense]|uniref:hypothetical protein n=1 Tax=Rhodococcoides yunnanense TaxID=278209 RepID=UPI0009333064|nr:hypothetical protein [Rhodococcus yunnanensis]